MTFIICVSKILITHRMNFIVVGDTTVKVTTYVFFRINYRVGSEREEMESYWIDTHVVVDA